MIIAIASGKGGTGKTMISVSLAKVFTSELQVLDCDVEEPNDHLFLQGTAIEEKVVSLPIPQVNEALCDGCGECARFCEYHAIVTFGTAPLIFREMCHGCGGCTLVCPRHAIAESNRRIGVIRTTQAGHATLIQGCLDVGVPMAPPLIRAVKARLSRNMPAIIDSPPGTSCPVIAAVRETDYVVLVTEPTPFGLHDLTLAADMVAELSVPFGVVINRVGIGDDRIHRFCREGDIPVLLEIPDDRRIAEAYSMGKIVVDALPEYKQLFESLIDKTFNVSRLRGEASHADI